MKKALMSFMIGVVGAVMVMAADVEKTPAELAMGSAYTILLSGDYAKAQAAYEKVLSDFPSAPLELRATAQSYICNCMINQKQPADAKIALEKALKDYSSASPSIKAAFQVNIGLCLYTQKKYDEATVAYQKAITDYPTASVGLLAGIQQGVGYCFERQDNPSQAIVEFGKVLSNYPTAPVNVLACAQMNIARLHLGQGASEQGQADCEAVLVRYPNASPSILLDAQYKLATALRYQKKEGEANKAYMAVVANYVQQFGASDEKGMIWKSFEQVNPKWLSSADYRDWLDNVIKVTKATEDNAKFLGKVKSELGKMQ